MNNMLFNYPEFSVHFFEEIRKRGFGSMNKTDYEIFIFNELLQSEFKDKSDHYISINLRISEAKVKKLRYEANLRYSKNIEDEAMLDFFNALKKIKVENIDKTIKFSLENISTRKYIDSLLKSDGRYSDSSFNSEIVTLSIDNYKYLLNKLGNLDIETNYLDTSIKNLLRQKQKQLTIEGVLSLAKDLGGAIFTKGVADLSVQGIKKIIEELKKQK